MTIEQQHKTLAIGVANVIFASNAEIREIEFGGFGYKTLNTVERRELVTKLDGYTLDAVSLEMWNWLDNHCVISTSMLDTLEIANIIVNPLSKSQLDYRHFTITRCRYTVPVIGDTFRFSIKFTSGIICGNLEFTYTKNN